MNKTNLTADDLIYGYMNGIFPMADSDGTVYWYSPDPRAVIPIESYKPARSLRPILNKKAFEVRINTDFQSVIRYCSVPRADGEGTWISPELIEAYTELHQAGMAYSVEAYMDNRLAGGLYGVAIGGVFFGESMFHLVSNASKIAFHFLMEILRKQGYELLDTQFINENVRRFGAVEIPRSEYIRRLKIALERKCIFTEVALEHLFKEQVAYPKQRRPGFAGPPLF